MNASIIPIFKKASDFDQIVFCSKYIEFIILNTIFHLLFDQQLTLNDPIFIELNSLIHNFTHLLFNDEGTISAGSSNQTHTHTHTHTRHT